MWNTGAVMDVVRYPFVYEFPICDLLKPEMGVFLCAAVEFNDGRIVNSNTGG